ncbi:four helix bundle protein [Cognataquiflexum aquatile]|uniref:four helix bundle protein n=1 Tax=Cognataquiflexum aquatile TaxID=2249427 RepID=UPI000DE8EC9D|nr:four helix bundle protein [Cognataquiflexum aquatile]
MDFRDLLAFQKAYSLAMEIFEVSKLFPKEEKYSLIDQIRRSSRSVCINISEGYRKRMYPLHFASKMSDADMENSETVVWLEFAFSCKYLEEKTYKQLVLKNQEIGKLLNYMIQNPEKFGAKVGGAKF